eukprot:GEMP01020898.1.p1 GENE.GEMP01020898.1~~GEMP01020898.1.p1  ORF type:complete len:559 (+),score=60.06 GEMP01020898.1:84-1679(+)
MLALSVLILPVAALPGPFDIVECFNQYLVLIIIAVALAVMWRYKNRIIFLLTGDDRLHGNVLDVVWYACRKCFGLFPNDCHYCGINFKKSCGRACGLMSTPLRLLNIRAGDLPFHGRGDFYLTIECGDHPPITTSVVEDADAKVVHFIEPINIRLRDNLLENKLVFSIKEEDVFGSKVLCTFSIEAKMLFDQLDIAKAERGHSFIMRRFRMDVVRPDWIEETPPWIIMEISTEIDSNLVDVHDNPSNHTTALMTRMPLLTNGTMGRRSTICEKYNPEELKESFELVDGQGRVVMEPNEGDLARLRTYKKHKLYESYIFFVVIFLVIAVYSAFRFYTWSCFHQFREITIGLDDKKHLPFSYEVLTRIAKSCKGEIPETLPNCFPSHEKVEVTCKKIDETDRPKAFAQLWYRYTGWNHSPLTVQCFPSICKVHQHLEANDYKIIAFLLLLCVLYLLHRSHVQDQIREMKNNTAQKMAHNLRGGKGTMYTAASTGVGSRTAGAPGNSSRGSAMHTFPAHNSNENNRYAPLQRSL